MWTDTLPTLLNLFERKVSPNLNCPLCGDEPESTLHALRDYSRVKTVWHASSMLDLDRLLEVNDGAEWLLAVWEAHREVADHVFTLA